jgi:DNA-binding transcriptional MerR regulator
MPATLSIGDFSRATNLTVKTLRYYHRVGLLEPTDVDPHTGYRRYTTDQIPAAQIIRRFRDLDMPIEQVQAVLATPDVARRNKLIAEHLSNLEDQLTRTRTAVASLRDLLQPSESDADVTRRQVPATAAAAISETIDTSDAFVWLAGALGELHAIVAGQGLTVTGPAGGVFADEIFQEDRGRATVYLPCAGEVRAMGRIAPLVVPATELAIIEHRGPHTDVDRSYGALATYVARHALAVDGPIREFYLTAHHETADESQWRTEIGWPIFGTQ